MNKAERPSNSGIRIDLSEDDLDPKSRATIVALRKGKEPLGLANKINQVILDALPNAIVKKIEKIVPGGYKIQVIELNIQIGGTLAGGAVKVVIEPK